MSPEQCLISSVLRTRDYATAAYRGVSVEMFRAYPDEWTWITRYVTKHGKTPSKLAFRQQFPEFQVAVTDDVGHFAEEVLKDYGQLLLTQSIREATNLLGERNLDQAFEVVQQGVMAAATAMGATSDSDILTSFDDIMSEVEEMSDRIDETGSAGIPTGFETWDEYTGGCKPGELVVVGARLGVGKTGVMLRMAASGVCLDYTVQFNALEMSRTQVALRMQTLLSSRVGKRLFRASQMLTGRTQPDLRAYRQMVNEIQSKVSGKFHVSDQGRGRVSPMRIASQIERNKPDAVYIDYLTLLEKKGEGDWKSVAALSGELKSMAMQYQIPIIAAVQLNRSEGIRHAPGKSAKFLLPGAESIGQSDAIGQDADQFVSIAPVSRTVRRMGLMKHRHGQDGMKWYVDFRPGDGVIEEIDREKALDQVDQDRDDQDEEED